MVRGDRSEPRHLLPIAQARCPVFVEVGQKVSKGAELCLIEVMKLFTSVRSEFVGTVRHIAVGDGELVEGGQALIYIESD